MKTVIPAVERACGVEQAHLGLQACDITAAHIGRIADHEIEQSLERCAIVADRKRSALVQSKRVRIAACAGDGLLTQVGADAERRWTFTEQGEKQRARAGAEI